jgi:HEAT repeat protein
MPSVAHLAAALQQPETSDRLQAALTAGTHPDDAFLEPLVSRCAVEPDFYVRDMLTWALARLPRELVLPRVVAELDSPIAQARSQALHTLSKLGDERAWSAITEDHLHDPDDEVARTAWRAAAGLAPMEDHEKLARELAREFGRGDLDLKRSLARALVELGEAGSQAAATAQLSEDPAVRSHAEAALRLIDDPEATFYLG